MTDDPVGLSGDLLYAARVGEDTTDLEARLADLDQTALAAALDDDDARKAFWLNVYNAVVQIRLGADPDRFRSRRTFFSSKLVTVAGQDLSLDEIEHGILRRSQFGWSLGYLGRPDFLVGDFEREFRVDELDPRIHFALNCGAASCPPIANYSRDVDRELDLASESYLGSEVAYDPDANRVRVPRLLLWYRGDFGGRSGIYEYLTRYGPVPEGERPKVSYKSYDWGLQLDQFREQIADQ